MANARERYLGECPNGYCLRKPNFVVPHSVDVTQDTADVTTFGSSYKSYVAAGPTMAGVDFQCGCSYEIELPQITTSAGESYELALLRVMKLMLDELREGKREVLVKRVHHGFNGGQEIDMVVYQNLKPHNMGFPTYFTPSHAPITPVTLSNGQSATFTTTMTIGPGGGGPAYIVDDPIKPPELEPDMIVPSGIEPLISYRMFDVKKLPGQRRAVAISLTSAEMLVEGDELILSDPDLRWIEQPVLKSTNHDFIWQPGKIEAQCGHGGHAPCPPYDGSSFSYHTATYPAPSYDKCGFYACDSHESLAQQSYNNRPVRATVKQWGRIVRGDAGTIRSQFAEITAIEVFEDRWDGYLCELDELVEGLKAYYKVPVTIVSGRQIDKEKLTPLIEAINAGKIVYEQFAKSMAKLTVAGWRSKTRRRGAR